MGTGGRRHRVETVNELGRGEGTELGEQMLPSNRLSSFGASYFGPFSAVHGARVIDLHCRPLESRGVDAAWSQL